MSIEKRIAAALGEIPADMVIKNARIISVTSGRIIENDVGVADGVILGIGRYKARQTIDADGAYLSSGFYDAHMHIESTLISPVEFSKTVIPMGTSAVFIDPHEISNVLGVDGIKYMLDATEGLPLDVYVMLPSCVPATNFETSGGKIEAKDLEKFWGHPRVVGLAEVMNFPGVIYRFPKVIEKIKCAKGHTIDGHAPGLSKKDLNAYLMANIRSDHESTNAKEAAMKLAAGLHLMIREGTSEHNLKDLLPVVKKTNAHRCMFCTDDRSPIDLLKEGHINYLIKKAVSLGLSPITAIQIATLNTAEYFRLTEKQGAIAVGHKADIVLFDDFRRMNIKMVFKKGVLVAKNGEMVVPIKSSRKKSIRSSINVKQLTTKSFEMRSKGDIIRVIELVPNQIITKQVLRSSKIKDSKLVSNIQRDILKLAVVERHYKTGNVGIGFVKGFGLKRGALASSVAHDSHNIIVVGTTDEDMLFAVNSLIKCSGGFVVVENSKVVELLPLPIAGLMSDQPINDVVLEEENLRSAAKKLGCKIKDPFQSLSFLALPVIPELKLTDKGLFQVSTMEFVDL